MATTVSGSGARLDSATAPIGQLVRVRTAFMAHIEVEQADDPDYRARCRDAYLYLPEDERFFLNVVNALTNRLPNRKHVVLEQGPYGVGKSLLDVVRGDLFSTPNNRAGLGKLPTSFWKEQVEELTRDTGFLVVYLAGAHPRVRERLDRALVEALSRALPPDLRLESQFRQAAAWLDQARSDATLAPLVAEFERQLAQAAANERPWTLAQLESGLRQLEPAALEVFRASLDAALRLPTARFGASTPDGVYEEVRAAHVGDGRRFAGVIIFFDEFSQWAASATPGDIASLQSFVEWVDRSNRVAMIMSSQARPQLQGEGYNAIETLIGRAHEVPFARSSYASLLGAALERTVASYSPVDSRPQWQQLTALHRELFGDDRPEQRVRAYYPFHPATVKALSVLADRLGYHERSIAQYLDPRASEDEGSFGRFLQGPLFEDDRGTLRLVTLDRLFPHFEARLRTDQQPIHSRYERVAAVTSDELGQRLVRTLALCDVLEAAAPLPTTVGGLVRLLNLPDAPESTAAVERYLGGLADEGLLFVDGDGRYKLAAAGGLSRTAVDRAINARKQALLNSSNSIGADLAIRRIKDANRSAQRLRDARYSASARDLPFSNAASGGEPQVEAIRYRQDRKVTRIFEIELVGWRELLERRRRLTAEPGSARYDTMLVVIATDTDARPADLDRVRSAARELASAGPTVAVPRAPLALSDPIQEILAVEQIGRQDPYRGTEFAKQALLQRENQLLSAIAAQVTPASFEWYTPDLDPMAAPVAANAVVEIAERVASYLGRGLPRGIETEGLVGNRQVQARNDVIDALLQGRDIQLTRSSRKPQRDRILRGAIAPLGLLELQAGDTLSQIDTATVIEPDAPTYPDMRTIWDILESAIGTGGDAAAITSVRDRLSRAPFWLPRDLALYILAAFVSFRALRPARGDQLLPRDSESLRALWSEPVGYRLRPEPRTPLSRPTRRLLGDLWTSLGDTRPSIAGRGTNPGAASALTIELTADLASDLGDWDAAIGRPCRELAAAFQLAWPTPVGAWLAFLDEVATGTLDREAPDTFAITLGQRLAARAADYPRAAGQLDGQLRQLVALAQEAEMLRRAAIARRGLDQAEPLPTAWEMFRAEPLNETRRNDVRIALTALSVAPTPASTPAQRPVSEDPAPGNIGTRGADDSTAATGTPAPAEQSADWRAAAGTIAGSTVEEAALRRCLGALQELLISRAIGDRGWPGDLVLARLFAALAPPDAAPKPDEVPS